MAIGPVDYQSMLAQLNFRPLQQGLAIRDERRRFKDQMRERQATRQLAEAKFTQEQLDNRNYQADIADLAANFSPQKLREVMWKYPGHLDALDKGFQTYSRGVQQDVIRDATGVIGALAADKPELALRTLNDRRQALVNGGVNTDETDALVRLVQSTDPADKQRAYALLGTIMAGAVGPEHAAGIMEHFGLGDKAEARRRDDRRADEQFEETKRHNRVMEGQGHERIGVTQRREARMTSGGGRGGNTGRASIGGSEAPPARSSTVGGKAYVQRNGKWYAQ